MTPYQLSFQINVGSQRLAVDFVQANRQLAFLKLSLVYNKSDPHKTIYDRCNVEVGWYPKSKIIRNRKCIIDICANK